MAFLAKWPPGLVVFAVDDDDGGERNALDGAGHRDVRETGVEAVGVDVCDCESCEVEGGGPLLALCRRVGRIQSPLPVSLRLRRPQSRIESAAVPLLERGR